MTRTVNVDTVATLKMLPLYDFGAVMYKVLSEDIPAVADLSPFRIGTQMELGYIGDFFIFRLTDQPAISGDDARAFSEEERSELSSKLSQINISDQFQLVSVLGESWYSKNIFTYVGEDFDKCTNYRW